MAKSSKRKGNSAPNSCKLRKARPARCRRAGARLEQGGRHGDGVVDEARHHHAGRGIEVKHVGTDAGLGRLARRLLLIARG